MRIAVVGDVHGHLALLYAILGRWQRETGQPIHLILQVGDLGAFGPQSGLDRATQKHARSDPEELGFRDFAGPNPPATLLDPRPPLVFIPGNHEDFEFLERKQAAAAASLVYPVSDDGKILGLRSGTIWKTTHEGRTVRIGGISGVAGRSGKRGYHRRVHLDDEEALELAERGLGAMDILISHERPNAVLGNFRHDLGGSEALSLLIEAAQPRFAFFGHYDRNDERQMGRTRVMGLAGCGYEQRGNGPAKRGGIVMVDWTGPEPLADRLDPPWLSGVRLGQWKHWR
jgi:hypothetical protein